MALMSKVKTSMYNFRYHDVKLSVYSSLKFVRPCLLSNKKSGNTFCLRKFSFKFLVLWRHARAQKRNGSIPYGDHQCSELKSVFSKKQGKCVQKKEYYIKTQLQVSSMEKKPLCFT